MQGSQMFPDAGTVGNTGTTTAATAATASSASYSSPVNAYVPVNIELPAPISLADYGIG
jgi:outer membrane protein assembly factor BamA